MKYELDQGFAAENALGLIVLKTDETMEVELRDVFAAANIACYHTRIPSHALVTPKTLAQMEKDLPETAGMLPPGVRFGAIGYGCTSGATVIGPDNVAAAVGQHHPDAKVTDPISAVMAGLRALNARKIGLLTPYVPDVTAEMQALLESEGFEITALGAFGQSEDRLIARISEASTLAAIQEIGASDCDAVFASCTNLRSFGILEQAEQRIGKPVVSSNLALGWHMLKLAGVETRGCGPGRLFQT
jgi:maleate isomerase